MGLVAIDMGLLNVVLNALRRDEESGMISRKEIREEIEKSVIQIDDPYAIEAGFPNGDGTYSVSIERLPLPGYKKPTEEWSKTYLYRIPGNHE